MTTAEAGVVKLKSTANSNKLVASIYVNLALCFKGTQKWGQLKSEV